MHVQSTKHKKAIRGETSPAKVTDYFCKPGSQTEDNVAADEVTVAFQTVKHWFLTWAPPSLMGAVDF